MSDSHPELVAATERLQRHLRESFVERDAQVSSVAWAPYPLLLLESRRELAAFAVSNGDQQEAFRSSYEFFRTMYGERHRAWDDLHLSFVFCVSHRLRDLETLYTGIETDVYFCRKYTVALNEPLDSELARLPFVPLHRPTGAALRPPSAQAVLKSMGASAKLAAALAGRVGEETILQNCLAGDYDLPTKGDVHRHDVNVFESIGSSVRLRQVQVENFRAYRKRCEFDVDADLVLLYGPNGFGKTSFFDALDFAATGDIGRLRLDRNEARFTKAASHLDADREAGVVSLTFTQSGEARTLRRTVADRRRAVLDGRAVERKEALLALTAATPVTGADHVEHLVRLFRASHVFSQDLQALTDELREHSRLSTDVVSRMLTFEDYVAARRKIGKVLETAQQRRASRDERVARLLEQKASLLDEMRSLKQHGETVKAPLLLDTVRERIRESLERIGIPAVRENDVAAEALGWRSALDAALTDARARRVNLESLRNEGSTVDGIRSGIDGRRRLGEEQRAVAAGLNELVRSSQLRQRELEAQIERGEVEIQGLEKQRDSNRWLKEALQQHSSLSLRHSELQALISAAAQNLSESTARVAASSSRVSEREVTVQRSEAELAALRQRITELTRLRERWAEWSRRRDLRAATVEAFTEAQLAAEAAAREESVSAEQLSIGQEQEAAASAEVAQFESAQTELQNLLARLETYVVEARCPACGADHQSADAVLRRLRDRGRATTASTRATERLDAIRAHVERLREDQRNARSRLDATKVTVDSLRVEIADIDKVDATFTNEVASVGVPSSSLGETLSSALEESSARESECAEENRKLYDALRREQEERVSMSSAVQSLSTQLTTTREAADALRSRIEEIRTEARSRQCSLEAPPSFIEESDARIADDLAKRGESIVALRAERDAVDKQAAEATRTAQAHQKATQAAQKSIRADEERIAEHERQREVLLGQLEAGDALDVALKENAERIQQLEEMKQEILSFEVAVDSAATAAAASRIDTALRSLERNIDGVNAEGAKEQKWEDQFRRIESGLARTQDDAVAGYTNIYGPLTSTIQRRLRAVSGFGDIVLKPARGAIDVHVLRNDERLPPTDFFSQSQQQILMLSLFLTACVTQTWSSFAPILLDDPISNFDDLNAYALLDLIGGLVEEEPGRRQFVFALCDEQIFRLARQRFRHLSGGMRVLRFHSPGPDGPIVEAV